MCKVPEHLQRWHPANTTRDRHSHFSITAWAAARKSGKSLNHCSKKREKGREVREEGKEKVLISCG